MCPPSAPVPPVTRAVPEGRQVRGAGASPSGACSSRRPKAPARAQRDLVLPVGAGEDADQPAAGRVVELVGQVDEAAPAVRVLEGGDPAEAPGELPGAGAAAGRPGRWRRRPG